MRFNRAVTIIAAFLVSVQVAAEPGLPGAAADSTDALDGFVEQQMAQTGIVGLAAAIILDRKVVWMQGYGFADKQRGVPFTPDTIMNIGSISKTVTGAALMHAVQEGKLDLDTDINEYLPFKVANPNFPEERITLRQLATHTSSIVDRPAAYEGAYHYGGDSPQSLGEFLVDYFSTEGKLYSRENFLDARPGSQREYSNIAAGLAGYIVELATDAKLNAYTREFLFTPLGMHNTGWFLAEIDSSRHSQLYIAQDGVSIPILNYGLTTYPDGGVRTSVADLSHFFMALLNGGEYAGNRVLDAESVAQMLKFQFTESNKPDNVLLAEKNSGIFWQSMFNVTRMGHGGSDPGVQTMMLADLSGRIGVILFINTSLSGAELAKSNAIFDAIWKHAESLDVPSSAGRR